MTDTQQAPRPAPLPFIARVSGISNYQDAARGVREGADVSIRREPANPYDSNACCVRTATGAVLGYLPHQVAQRLVARGESSWAGEIVEVLRGETWGLRVKVSTAVPDRAADTAADTGTADPADTAAADTGAAVARQVVALSGRALGTLVRADDGAVVVRGDDGTERLYPATVVRVTG